MYQALIACQLHIIIQILNGSYTALFVNAHRFCMNSVMNALHSGQRVLAVWSDQSDHKPISEITRVYNLKKVVTMSAIQVLNQE